MTKKNQILNFLRETWETDLPEETDVSTIMTIMSDNLYKEQNEIAEEEAKNNANNSESPTLNGVI